MNKLKKIGYFILGLFQAILIYFLFVFNNLFTSFFVSANFDLKNFSQIKQEQNTAKLRVLIVLFIYGIYKLIEWL